ncbi:hypothetical protein WICMUC_000827 [Wickerhamomyces mucosus]|uniref:Protein YOP1 n=1 Tax=Wickerhamomyces mucosus TaxID=1378264 RepID=A0A9P8TI79_9ASCO|nr:hypothetical protein WICMUC_000827 [Wickerhamomyces mucosus]
MLSLIFSLLSISFVFPIIASFKAIKSQREEFIKEWAIYWLIFAILTVFESYFYFILKFIPLYSLLRVYISIWLILPQTKGANFIYIKYLEPFLNNHEAEIEQRFNSFDPFKIFTNIFGLKSFGIIDLISKENSTQINEKPSIDNLSNNFDNFLVQNFYKKNNYSISNSNSNNDISLITSLGGVLQSLIFNPNKDVLKKREFGLDYSNNSTNNSIDKIDFDVVGKDEIDNLKLDQNKSISSSSSSSSSKNSNGYWFFQYNFWTFGNKDKTK